MKPYLLLFRNDPANFAALSPSDFQQDTQRWVEWMGQLAQSGSLRGGDQLGMTGKLVRGQSKLVTEGPFSEAREVIGGYVKIEVPDYEQALLLAQGCPILQVGGSVEIREAVVNPLGM